MIYSSSAGILGYEDGKNLKLNTPNLPNIPTSLCSFSNTFRFFFLIAFALLPLASHVSGQTFSGQATAARVTTTVVGQPVITTAISDTGDLPNAGGNITLTSVGVNIPPPLSVGASNVSAVGAASTSNSNASINNINIGLLSNTITASVVSSQTQAACPGEILSGSSTITDLTINSLPVSVGSGPNQVVQIFLLGNPIGTLIVNEQIVTPRSITVNALHLFLTDPVSLTTTDVVIASSRSGINCAVSPLSNLYSGRGTGVRVNQANILTGDLTTLVSDTGPLPTSGGSINVSTTGAGVLPPLLSTGVVTSTTQGGTPANTSSSTSSVDNLGIDLLGGIVTVGAIVLNSRTDCQCTLSAPTCTANSQLVGLVVRVFGLVVPVTIDGTPNQIVNIPVLGLGSITLTLNGRQSGGAADITAFPLRIQTSLLGLVSTDITIARSHSDIVCLIPTSAAPASISGRVTDPYGRAMRGVTVTAMGMDGFSQYSTTNSFGYYKLSGLPIGDSYMINARDRRYRFASRFVSLMDDLSGFDLVPIPISTGLPKVEAKQTAADALPPKTDQIVPVRRQILVIFQDQDGEEKKSPTKEGSDM